MHRTVFGLAAAALLVAPLAAQDGAREAATGDPAVEGVLASYYEAIGGTEAIASIESLVLTGRRIEPRRAGVHREVGYELSFRRPNSVRLDVHIENQTGTQAYDGETGWLLWPFSGVTAPSPMDDNALQQFLDENQMISLLVDPEARGNKVELVGETTVDETAAVELEVTRPSGDVQRLFLDAETHLPIQRTAVREFLGEKLTLTERYSDYRSTAGLLLAYSTKASVEGGKTPLEVETRIEAAEANSELALDHFSMPSSDAAQSE